MQFIKNALKATFFIGVCVFTIGTLFMKVVPLLFTQTGITCTASVDPMELFQVEMLIFALVLCCVLIGVVMTEFVSNSSNKIYWWIRRVRARARWKKKLENNEITCYKKKNDET